jgi:hypothetical protein
MRFIMFGRRKDEALETIVTTFTAVGLNRQKRKSRASDLALYKAVKALRDKGYEQIYVTDRDFQEKLFRTYCTVTAKVYP